MKTARWTLPVAIAIGALALLAWGVLDLRDPFDDAPFDRAAWVSGPPAVRTPMARAAASRLERAMAESEVLRLLGPPDSEKQTRSYSGHFGEPFPSAASRTLRYDLDSGARTSLMGLDDPFLYVHLNDAGLVVHAEIGGG